MREGWKLKAPGNLVQKLEQALGQPAEGAHSHGMYQATFGAVPLSVSFTNTSTRFTVMTEPGFMRAAPAIAGFLASHSIHGIVTGYKLDSDGDCIQWFDIMPRFADSFAVSVAEAAQEGFEGAEGWHHSPELPGELTELVAASDWDVTEVEHHPALADPEPALVLSHPATATTVVIADTGVWVACHWPFDKTSITRMCKGMAKFKCLVDFGPDGWHQGHYQNHEAERGGVMYARWDISLKTLASMLKPIKGKGRAKRAPKIPVLPAPTHYSMTIH